MIYLAFLATYYIHQLSAAQDCQNLSCSAGIPYKECCDAHSLICEWNDQDMDCTGEGEDTASCCLDITPAPTSSTTPAPTTTTTTAQPSCPINSITTCSYNTQDCCTADIACQWQQTDYCLMEGDNSCCYVTTPAPTTTTTTPAPTTTTTQIQCPINGLCVARKTDQCCLARTACVWTCPEREVSLDGNCCEATPVPTTTTTTPAPTTTTTTTTTTTPEPTTTTTTPAPTTTTTTTTSTTSTTSSTTSSTSTTSTTSTTTAEPTTTMSSTTRTWPTPRPTMRSAMKWEMIHPAYNGGDGELLWHVYYGDFSNDERLDEFRSKEMWNIDEIRPIVESDNAFIRYHNDESQKLKQENSQSAITGSSRSYFTWLIIISIVLLLIFIAWCKYGPAPERKSPEYTPLLH